MVFLDVVYNHFGPEGNFLGRYAPQFFTTRHHTPWGAAVNFEGRDARPVRQFFIENALYWLDEFHFDGLRLDAVHHLLDDSQPHILAELARAVHDQHPNRHVHLMLENEENDTSLLLREPNGHHRYYTAQWNDDVHHVLHTALTGEGDGYYGDYVGDDRKLIRALSEGFAFQGEIMKCRGTPRGKSTAGLPPSAFITFLQNHDQVGNRALGDRLASTLSRQALRAASAIQLLLPQIPMLFMGEEWESTDPFPFFCDFGGELAESIREGRRREFARFPQFADSEGAAAIPDPTSRATFQSAKLNWAALRQPDGAAAFERYQKLLTLRRNEIVPRLPSITGAGRAELRGRHSFRIEWAVGTSESLVLEANLSTTPGHDIHRDARQVLWAEGECVSGRALPPWGVVWFVRSAY
jgi:maltooligosyltrehalose trehalohydrolase